MSQKNKSTFCNWKNQPFSRFFKKAADFFGCRWFIFTWLSAVRFQWSRKKEERHQRLFGTDIALRSNSPLMWRSNVFRLRFIPTGQRPWWWFSRLLFTQRVLIHRISLYRISDLPADSSHFGQQSIGPSVKYVVYILGFQVIWRINSGHYSVRWLLDLLYNTC